MTRRVGFAAVALLFALVFGSAVPASADTASDVAAAQARQAVIDQVRDQLGTQLATALTTQDQLTQALKDNAAQQAVLQGEIDDANAKIASYEGQIVELQVQVDATNVRIQDEKAQIASLARALYAQPSSYLLLVVESKSIGDLITRVNDLRSAGNRATALKAKLKEDLGSLDVAIFTQQQYRDTAAKLRDKEAADLTKLQQLQAVQQKAQADLAQQIDATKHELAIIDGQSAVLAQEIADLLQQQEAEIIAAAEQSVWDQVQTITPTGLPTSVSKGHSTKYRFVWPEPTSVLTQPFGPTSLWYEPPYGGYAHFHTGIDMSSPEGSPVLAADDGVILLAGSSIVNGQLVGYGNYVVIAHTGGYSTLYGHLKTLGVKVGDQVHQGQVIGTEGSTGNSTGAHLHFELRQGNTPIDPAPFLPPGNPSPYNA